MNDGGKGLFVLMEGGPAEGGGGGTDGGPTLLALYVGGCGLPIPANGGGGAGGDEDCPNDR